MACVCDDCDYYNHLRAAEGKKRPATDFMETLQKGLDASIRARIVNWLVEAAEDLRLVPETLYLTVNYMDRYLSEKVVDVEHLTQLGAACMMVATKYEESRKTAPGLKEFCRILDYTCKDTEIVEAESYVLKYLKFELTAPTTKCFLRLFVCAAQGVYEVQYPFVLQLECLSDYIAELSLLEYNMLCFAPSLIAASSVFLAKFILNPNEKSWNSALRHYTQYQSSDLQDCVMALHSLCCSSQSSDLPAIREKYKFVAKMYCSPPPSMPEDLFHD